MPFLQNLTRRNEIGANCYLIDWEGTRVILDAGMHPKQVGRAAMPDLDLLPDNSVDAVFLTHSHHDHSGAMPILQDRQPDADVFMTEPAAMLTDAILHNSVTVMTSQREEEGIMEYPLFTHKAVEKCAARWRYAPLRRAFPVGSGPLTAELYDAGHILGSAGVMLRAGDKSLFYTGDIHFDDQSLQRGARFPEDPVDVLVMETTRGANDRPEAYDRRQEELRLAKVIRETFAKNGALLLPVFAMGKTQEILIMLHTLKQQDEIPAAPVIIGGLGAKMTMIHDHFSEGPQSLHPELKLGRDLGIVIPPRPKKNKKRTPLECQPGHIYCLSSGMMTENTTSNVFARKFLPNERNTLCFVGYTDPDSPGYTIRHSQPGAQVILDRHRGSVTRNCRMEEFDFSGHAPRHQIRDFAISLKPKRIFLIHGDLPALEWFRNELSLALPATDIVIPPTGHKVELFD